MERPVGTKFKYKRHTLEVVEHRSCDGCHFNRPVFIRQCWSAELGPCSMSCRSDHKSVIFKKVENYATNPDDPNAGND